MNYFENDLKYINFMIDLNIPMYVLNLFYNYVEFKFLYTMQSSSRFLLKFGWYNL